MMELDSGDEAAGGSGGDDFEPAATAASDTCRPQWRTFAHAYADPRSATYLKKVESYRRAYPLPDGEVETPRSRENARRSAYKLLERDEVKAEIEHIRCDVRGATGLTKATYVTLLAEREAFYAKRGAKGDAQASAAILKLIGTAIGALVQRTEDVTPPERRRPLDATAMIAALERLTRLREPVPSASRLAAAEEISVRVLEAPISPPVQ